MSGVLVVGDVITDIIVMPEGPMVRGSVVESGDVDVELGRKREDLEVAHRLSL